MAEIKIKKLPLLYTAESSGENELRFENLANKLARSRVDIQQCKKCGRPVIFGYCCNTCGDSNPTLLGEYKTYWDKSIKVIIEE
jgi:hypothetical protein